MPRRRRTAYRKPHRYPNPAQPQFPRAPSERPRPTPSPWWAGVLVSLVLTAVGFYAYSLDDPVAAPIPPILAPAAADGVERRGVRCTGSMEPAIACTDEITYRRVDSPADIGVGDIIRMQPSCPLGDGRQHRGVAHRIVDVKVEDDQHWYWPKGDAHREADGCWVPFEHVKAVAVEVHRGVRPANAELRELVNAAMVTVNGLVDRYCGVGVGADDCELSTVAQYDELEAAADLFDCWYEVASTAEYPGHIPSRC